MRFPESHLPAEILITVHIIVCINRLTAAFLSFTQIILLCLLCVVSVFCLLVSVSA